MQKMRPSWGRVGKVLVSITLATAPISPTIALAASTSVDKVETVHVSVDGTGRVSSITVDDLLTNDGGSLTLVDRSLLTGIDPQDEDITFVQDGTSLTWSTTGEEVSYEGVSSQQPPVEVAVSYTLDGTRVEPSQLAGASGHLVVRLDYRNTSSALRMVGDTQELVYTPFVCMSAVLLDADVFRNVEVTNGRIIEDKGGLAVIGYALPGLRESLGPDADDLDLDLPEFVEFSADVSDLVLDPIYTVVTPELFSDLDTSAIDLGLDDLDEGSDALEEAMGALVEGSGALHDALDQLASGGSQLGTGMAELKKQLGLLPDGIGAFASSASALSDGLSTAAEVAGQLSGQASALGDSSSAAREQVADAQDAVGAAETSLGDAADALDGLDERIGSAKAVSDAAQSVSDAATAAQTQLQGTSTALGDAQGGVNGAQTILDGLSDEQRAALGDSLDALEAQLSDATSGIQAAQTAADSALQELETASSSAETLAGVAGTLDEASAAASTAHDKLGAASSSTSSATQSLAAVLESLDALSTNATSLSGGADALATQLAGASGGAQALSAQLGTLAGQAPQLLTGIDALGTGANQLADALAATASGSAQLTEGLQTFDDEGIAKLTDALGELGDDAKGLSDRLDALRAAAEEYDNFSGKAEGQTGSVRFIYKTERIG